MKEVGRDHQVMLPELVDLTKVAHVVGPLGPGEARDDKSAVGAGSGLIPALGPFDLDRLRRLPGLG